jgi:hypothetical protein
MKDEKINGQRIRCWDNGGSTCDRYTVAYMDFPAYYTMPMGQVQMLGMSAAPFHPQGFGQHTVGMPGRHLGKRIKFSELPEDCQKLVQQDTKEETA